MSGIHPLGETYGLAKPGEVFEGNINENTGSVPQFTQDDVLEALRRTFEKGAIKPDGSNSITTNVDPDNLFINEKKMLSEPFTPDEVEAIFGQQKNELNEYLEILSQRGLETLADGTFHKYYDLKWLEKSCGDALDKIIEKKDRLENDAAGNSEEKMEMLNKLQKISEELVGNFSKEARDMEINNPLLKKMLFGGAKDYYRNLGFQVDTPREEMVNQLKSLVGAKIEKIRQDEFYHSTMAAIEEELNRPELDLQKQSERVA